MKTLIIFQEVPEVNLNYFIVDGDYSRFNGVAINLNNHEFNDEFSEFMYDENGHYKHKLSQDTSLIQNKEWDVVAHCVFVL